MKNFVDECNGCKRGNGGDGRGSCNGRDGSKGRMMGKVGKEEMDVTVVMVAMEVTAVVCDVSML